MQIGTAQSTPGELATGYLNVTDLPTGAPERLPVLVAEGAEDGPTLWVTAAIHGNEVTGLATAQDAIHAVEPVELRGTVVCLPLLNPSGLRQTTRTSYYHGEDPNRLFPDPVPSETRPPGVQELINRRIYEAFADSADALIDLHTAQPGSMPYLIRDRVLYGKHRTREEAEELAERLDRLAVAFDFPIVNEYPVEYYTRQDFDRTTPGAALNGAGIPAVTVELGGHWIVHEDTREAGIRGVFNVLVELGMLDAVPSGIAAAAMPETPVDYPTTRATGHSETPGIARHHVEAGDVVAAGQTVAEILTPHGERKATVESEHDGYVLAREPGAAIYENDSLLDLAVRDDGDLVVEREE